MGTRLRENTLQRGTVSHNISARTSRKTQPLDFGLSTTSAMPPRTAMEAPSSLGVVGSPSKMTPPIAAMTGTLSCTVAALVALSPRKAAYQIA